MRGGAGQGIQGPNETSVGLVQGGAYMNRPVWMGLGDGLILAGVLLGISAICFALFPDVYESTGVIYAEKESQEPTDSGVVEFCFGDPYWVTTEFEKLQSKCILYPVITNLGLLQKWAKKLDEPGIRRTEQAYILLKRQMDVRQARDSSRIEIKAWAHAPKEAAAIVNAIAEEYRNNRLELQKEMAQSRLATYSNQIAKMDLRIAKLEQRLMDRAFEPSTFLYPGELNGKVDPWKMTRGEALHELEMNQDMRDHFTIRSIEHFVALKRPKELVQIVTEAAPASHPNCLSSMLTLVLALAAILTVNAGRFLLALSWQEKQKTKSTLTAVAAVPATLVPAGAAAGG